MKRRYLKEPILESLKHFPVVLLTGARQVGKSTLAQSLKAPPLHLYPENPPKPR
jgi:predicted AAA+ superfamily ATPase